MKQLFNQQCGKFKQIITEEHSFAVLSHLSPDGDNIGSITAMQSFLEDQRKDVNVIEFDPVPDNLKFLMTDAFTENTNKAYDVVICLDCANKSRLGDVDALLKKAKYVVNIDHHLGNERFGTLNIIYPEMSSTCELLYHIFEACKFSFNKSMATSLLTGILTDTGRFLYDSSDENTLYAAGQLIKYGADKKYLMNQLFQSEKFETAQLKIEILRRTEIFYDKVALTYMNLNDLESNQINASELDDVVNYYRDTDKIILSIFLKQKEKDIYKVSFRSKKDLDVNKIASQLGGGGHKNASGCLLTGNLIDCKEQIFKILDKIVWTEF